nr:glycosyltransferase [uncultured Carboxylicivirga sp.]
MKLVVISNMYPSKKNPSYGVFVQNFFLNINSNDRFDCKLIKVEGRGKNLFYKLIKYIVFWGQVFAELFRNTNVIYYVHYANHTLIPFLFFKGRINKCVINFHGGDVFPENKISNLISKLTKSLYNKSKGVVVPSEYFRKVVVEKFNIDEKKVFISPSAGIDRSIFFKNKYSPLDRFLRIGYIGRLDEGKGVMTLLNSLKLLLNKEIEFKTDIIGGGSLIKYFKDVVKDYKLEGIVSFKGIKRQDLLYKYINEFDVLIFPSEREGESLGLVGLEAMSCGVPVIGSNIGGIATYVDQGRNGYLFEVGNEGELTTRIMEFYNLGYKEKLLMSEYSIRTAEVYESKVVNRRMIEYLLNLND